MPYRMTELTDFVRVGKTSNGSLDIEVWTVRHGWKNSAEGDVEEILLPPDATDLLFEYLR